ncbi:hypothetical protein GCM10009665_38300 [Kitasatospora nipponensis]|uniref:eCIS core domain-containing protein n=1 Tax=Kitasatospora nipponensis TaxID=258049 RepID=A0ABN1WHQ1_9ACTN
MRAHDQQSQGGPDEQLRTDGRRAAQETAVQAAGAAEVGGELTARMVLALQRTIGNAAVAPLVEQRRRAHDPSRGRPDPCGGPQAPDRPVQRSGVHEVLRSPGQPMPDVLRSEMESRLGADFGEVRLHDDAAAARSAREIGARAYTSGRHVVIGAGGADQHTLAHELTHVIQQRQGSVAGTDHGDGLSLSDPGDRFERAAEANAVRAMSGEVPARSAVAPAQGSSGSGGGGHDTARAVQRYGGRHGMTAETMTNPYETWTYVPPADSPFQVHIDVAPDPAFAPVATNGHQYAVGHVNIRGVEIGTQRGPTRFGGSGQKAHTTAWTLTRQSLTAMEGRPASVLVGYIEDSLAALATAAPQTGDTPAGIWNTLRARADTLRQDAANHARPLHLWSAVLSDLLVAYVKAYQVCPATTYNNGHPDGDGEADAMNALWGIEADTSLPTNLGTRRQEAKAAISHLQDYPLSHSSLPIGNRDLANEHFWRTLAHAFPKVAFALQGEASQNNVDGNRRFNAGPAAGVNYAAIRTNMTAAAQPGSAGSTVAASGTAFKLAAGSLDKGFAVDLLVSPQTRTGANSVASHAATAVEVSRVRISLQERPYTQYKPDAGAHLSSWSLLVTAVRALEGGSAREVLRWLHTGVRRTAGRPPLPVGLANDWTPLRHQVTTLLAHGLDATTTLTPHAWSELLSSVMRGYLMLQQASSLSTVGTPVGDSRPGSNGEGPALTNLQQLQAQVVAGATPLTPAVRGQAVTDALVHFDHRAARTKIIYSLMFETGPNTVPEATDDLREHLKSSAGPVINLKRSIDEWVRSVQTAFPDLFCTPLFRQGISAKHLRKAVFDKLGEDLTANEMSLVEQKTTRKRQKPAVYG